MSAVELVSQHYLISFVHQTLYSAAGPSIPDHQGNALNVCLCLRNCPLTAGGHAAQDVVNTVAVGESELLYNRTHRSQPLTRQTNLY